MILREDAGATSVPALDRVGEAVIDPCIDNEFRVATLHERSFELGEHRPDQATASMIGIDEHVEQRRVPARPPGAGDREADEPVVIEDRGHQRPS
jgi:hypothetical protein